MKFPTHCRRVTNSTGRVFAWGWSERSAEEAEARALARLERILDWLKGPRTETLDTYSYAADGVLTEEVVERFDLDGGGEAVVSRNAYGSLVLNNDRVLFIDVDVPRRRPSLGARVARLWGRKPVPYEERIADQVAEIQRWQADHPQHTLRAYRSHSGLRLVVINALFPPGDPVATTLLEALCNDPLYRTLCQRQACYRARLTPKPWRVGLSAPRKVFPLATEGEREEFEGWLAAYEERRRGYATCSLLGTWGKGAADPVVDQVLAFHDRLCGLSSGAPLA